MATVTEFHCFLMSAAGYACYPYDNTFRYTGESAPVALETAILSVEPDPDAFRSLDLEAQPALVAGTTKAQRKALNQYQRKLVQKERIKRYTGQSNPPEDALDGIALDSLADALQEALDEGENTTIKASRFAAWLAERAAVQAEFPYPPEVPD